MESMSGSHSARRQQAQRQLRPQVDDLRGTAGVEQVKQVFARRLDRDTPAATSELSAGDNTWVCGRCSVTPVIDPMRTAPSAGPRFSTSDGCANGR